LLSAKNSLDVFYSDIQLIQLRTNRGPWLTSHQTTLVAKVKGFDKNLRFEYIAPSQLPIYKTINEKFEESQRIKKQQLEEVQQIIKQQKNQKICQKCGSKNDAESTFCGDCGEKFEEEMIIRFCPECGEKNKSKNKFCEKCGTKLGD
jgi:ribosomal protein L40E